MKETKFQKYDAVEVKGVELPEGYKWWPGYYILEIEKDGSCLISYTYRGDHNITQLSWPHRISPDSLRKPEIEPKLSVTGGIYSNKNFLQEYGAFMVRSFYRDQ